MVAKIHNWTSKVLSFAGRLQLIQAVLYSIQVYWTLVFILPKSIIKDVVEQLLRWFLKSLGILSLHLNLKRD